MPAPVVTPRHSLRLFWRSLPFMAGGLLVVGLLWLGDVADRPLLDSRGDMPTLAQPANTTVNAINGAPDDTSVTTNTSAAPLVQPRLAQGQDFDRIQAASLAGSAQAVEPGEDSSQHMSPTEEKAYYGEDSNSTTPP